MERIYIRSITEYISGVTEENPDGNKRVKLGLQNFPQTKQSLLLAGKLPPGSKIGSMSLVKGTTIDDARKHHHIGEDMTPTLAWGDIKSGPDYENNEFLYEVTMRGLSDDVVVETVPVEQAVAPTQVEAPAPVPAPQVPPTTELQV